MRIRCKGCGTTYFIKDELVTEKGIKVKCSKCGTTFIIKKKTSKTKPPPEEEKIDIEKVLELTREAPFWEQFKSAGWFLKIAFIASTLALMALSSFAVYKFLQVKVQEKFIYSAVALKYGYIDDAIKELERLTKKYPHNPTFSFLLAEALNTIGDSRAKEYYLKTANLVKNEDVKGSLLVRAGMVEEGIKLLEDALVTSSHPEAVTNDLGVAYLMTKKQYKRGLSLLESIVEDFPYEAIFNMATFYIKTGKGKAEYVEEMYSRFPMDVAVLINTAVYYAKKGDYGKALQLLFMAKGEHRWKPIVWHDTGVVYKLMGDDRYRAYFSKDIIPDDELHIVDYRFLLNPEVKLP